MDYLTSPVSQKVESWTHYNEWGEITHNAVLKMGLRELDLVKRYATHDYDAVLGMYYAKARFYDAENRRFASVDPVLEPSRYMIKMYVGVPQLLVQYLYVQDAPLVFIDKNGKFLTGTVLTEKAIGADVLRLNSYLYAHNYMYTMDFSYTAGTTYAVKEFQKDHGLTQTGTVARDTWERMGFTLNSTFEDEFWSGRKGSDTLNIVISGNDITINYSPSFYISEVVKKELKVRWPGNYYTLYTQCERAVDDDTYIAYVERAVQGLKYWSQSSICIQGISGSVTVNVTPTRTWSKSKADIRLNISKEGRGLTLGVVFWRAGKTTGFDIPLGWPVYSSIQNNGVDAVSNVVAHEFGHVLGIMDAYGEWYGAEAPIDKAPINGIMRSPYRQAPVFTNNDYEMILYAWTTNRMQGYVDGIFAAESQAFFH